MAKDDVLLAHLQKAYCPPLDITTLLAILSDYDIKDPEQLKAARQSLDGLTVNVEAEEASGFDPSGSGGRDESRIPHPGLGSESGHSQVGWSSYTDDTSLSQGASAFDTESLELGAQDDAFDVGEEKDSALVANYNAQLEGLDIADKEAALLELFPGIKPFDVKRALKKCKGNAGLAVGELLHQVFLEENGLRHKGVEGFSDLNTPAHPRKSKGKKRARNKLSKVLDPSQSEALSPTLAMNKWDSVRADIEFISSRTNIPSQQVGSLHHKHGASIPATIGAILEAEMALEIKPENVAIEVHAQELLQDFPTIPYPKLIALIQLTYPSATSAHELAKALTMDPKPTGSISIEFRLAPPDLYDKIPKRKPEGHNAVFTSDEPSLQSSLPYLEPVTNQNAERLLALRDEAFSSAAALSRRGKSDHLMYGAASHYSSLGRNYNSAAKKAMANEVDALVARQSSGNTLDLHGVKVRDALRIAKDGVERWWVSVGMGSAEGGKGGKGAKGHEAYTIVTGKGIHSQGGRGKLGPAVFGCLAGEGWRVEASPGVVIVTGRR